MNTGRTVFSQIMDMLPHWDFSKCVKRYQGDRKIQKFSCMDQFLCMAFAQLTYRESLRDIEVCLRGNPSKLYHMGIRSHISRSTLADANENRDWRIYADFAQIIISIAKELYVKDDFGINLEAEIYALDSTTIDLCLSLFPWARFRNTKAAIKLHTLLNLRGNIPEFIHISNGKLHDVNILDILIAQPRSFYLMDRGYVDFARLYTIQQASAFFVTRCKRNFQFKRRYSHPVDKSVGLRSDQTIITTGINTSKEYPIPLRRIRYYDIKTDKSLIFITNNFDHQAAPANQSLLWDISQCCKDAGLDSCLRLCTCSDFEKTAQSRPEPLHNSTVFKCVDFRENTHFRSVYARVRQNSKERL